MAKLRRPDGTIGFSDLKQFAESPAHFKHNLLTPFKPTRAMRIGTLVDRLIFNQPLPPIWDGRRQGKEWKAFEAENADRDICTTTELEEAKPIAAAAMASELGKKYLTGRAQVPLIWEMNGVACGTRGIDCVGEGWISDLKVTQTTKPERWMWHALRMQYDAQLTFYQEGCRQNGIDTSQGLRIVGVAKDPPYLVTVLRLSPSTIEKAEAKLYSWLEQLKNCEESDEWPGYCQSEVELGAEEDLELLGLDGEEDTDESLTSGHEEL